MKKNTVTIVVVVAAVAIALLWGIGVNNKLVTADENVQQVCSLSARYPLQAILKIGPTRYRLSTDEVLTQTYAVLLTVFLLAIGFLLYLYHQFYRPLELLLDEAFQHLETGDLSYRIPEKQAKVILFSMRFHAQGCIT